MSDLNDQLERMQADGRITVTDADEVRNFASFLRATARLPRRPEDRTKDQQRTYGKAYRQHYPDSVHLAVVQ